MAKSQFPCAEKICWLLLWGSFWGAVSGQSWSPERMLELVGFTSPPLVSPDGKWLAYGTTDPRLEENIRAFWPVGTLHLLSLEEGRTESWSLPGQCEALDWNPAGKGLLLSCRQPPGQEVLFWWRGPEQGVRQIGGPFPEAPREERFGRHRAQWLDSNRILLPRWVKEEAEAPPRVYSIRSTDPIMPGDALFTDRRRWELVLVSLQGESRILTPPLVLREVQASPDGRWVAYRAVTEESIGRFRGEQTRWWLIQTESEGDPQPLFAGPEPAWVVLAPSGRLLFPQASQLRVRNLETKAPEQTLLAPLPARTFEAALSPTGRYLTLRAERPGSGPPDPQMYSLQKPTQDLLLLDLQEARVTSLTEREKEMEILEARWAAQADLFFLLSRDPESLRQELLGWEPGQGARRLLLVEEASLGDLSVDGPGRTVVLLKETATSPADLFLFSPQTGREVRLTRLNPDLDRAGFVPPRRISFFSADGEPLQALLYLPPGTSPQKPVPVVTYVYEKLTPSQHRFNPDAQLHVARGYGYLMPDVLVKPGFTGESFVKCVVPAVNRVRESGLTTESFGITGGSFGGYAGLFLISHVDLFDAAVLRAPPSEFFSTWGDGRDRDVWTIETGQARTGGDPWQVPERYFANSPFFFADRVRTPVLIFHGEKDFTVPFQQGMMMFQALRRLGKVAELVVYREGDHSVVRGSRHDFLDLYRRTFEWWDRYLKKGSQ